MANQTVTYFKKVIDQSSKLTPKEREILSSRLSRGTLVRISRKYKISAERVRQLEKNALLKLTKKVWQMLLFNQ